MNSAKSNQPNNTETVERVDHLFRHHAGRMTAALARRFGIEQIDLIEDSIQDAMIKALKIWPFKGVPANPEGWLVTVARNRLIDQLRRGNRSEPLDDIDLKAGGLPGTRFADELDEDVLRMMFACSDPAISPDSQVALTLKVVSGFSVREIASAFLAADEAIAKLITRAKAKLRGARLEIPPPSQLAARRDSVLKALYLMFNEGYNTSNGDHPVRTDLCHEAIRLTSIIADHPMTSAPKAFAALALFRFQSARLPARFDADGDILRMSEQDRSKWNRRMIEAGLRSLARSAAGNELSVYHLEAEIASIHAVAADYESTDWSRMIRCYDRLAAISPSPIVRLNRAIAVSKIHGNPAAIAELETLGDDLRNYPLFHITLGELYHASGAETPAAACFERAGRLSGNSAMYRFLRRRTENRQVPV